MRVCSSCGRENPDDRDFCECGEYLRWDPTGVVQAVTPEMLEAARQAARPAASGPPAAAPSTARPAPPAATAPPHPVARATAPRPAPAGPGNGHAQSPAGPTPTMRQPAAGAQSGGPEPAAISLRLPEGELVGLGESLAMGAEPGGRARLLVL